LRRFRDELRTEITAQYPAALTSREFLDRAQLFHSSHLTRTGALLFASNPAAACTSTMVKCVRYYGSSRAADREIATYDGTVPHQIVAARQFVAHHVRRGEAPNADQSQSAPIYAYPMVAVREILANALTHRDYAASDSCVHVRLFEDRLEISSPGTWTGRELTSGVEHDLAELDGHSIKRNFRLAHILSWIRLVEGEGSGIPTALRDCAAAHSPNPTVVQDQGFVTVTIRPAEPPPEQRLVRTGIVSTQVVRPAGLPPDTRYFVGRSAEVTEITGLASDWEPSGGTPLIVSIDGPPGVGKSALAVRCARLMASRFPDGQLFVNLHGTTGDGGPTPPSVALTGFLTALGVDPKAVPAEPADQAALYRSLIADRRMLVVLDNAEDAAQVRLLLPSGPACMALITTRRRLVSLVAREGAHAITLNALDYPDAVAFLTSRLDDERTANEPEAVAALIDLCGGLPLALAIIAARVETHAERPFAELIAELRDARLDSLFTGDRTTDLRSVFSWSYVALDARAARVYRLLSLHRGPEIGVAAAASLVDLPLVETRFVLNQLNRAWLIEAHDDDRYQMHDLLRLYAAERLTEEDDEDVRAAARRRVLDHYLHVAIAADRYLNPNRDPVPAGDPVPGVVVNAPTSRESALSWFDTEYANLLAAVADGVGAGFDAEARRLALALTTFANRRGRWRDLVEVQQLGLDERSSMGVVETRLLRSMGAAHTQLGEYQTALAHYWHALELSRAIGDRRGEAYCYLATSGVHERMGALDDELTHAGRALEISREIADYLGEAQALNVLSRCAAQRADVEAAERHARQALELFRTLNVPDGEAASLYNLGYACHQAGDHARAIGYLQQAVALWRAQDSRYDEAATQRQLGDVLYAAGEYRSAVDAWRSALAVLDQLNDPDADAIRARLGELVPDAPDPVTHDEPGSHRIIVFVDLVGSPALTDTTLLAMRADLDEIMRRVFQRLRLSLEDCTSEDRGDGILLLVPPVRPESESLFAARMPQELARALHEINRTRESAHQIRIRVALHAGEVRHGRHGIDGSSINFAARLVDSTDLKRAVAGAPDGVGVILSSLLYDAVQREPWRDPSFDPAAYREVRVAVKTTEAQAWIHLPGTPQQPYPRPRPRGRPKPDGQRAVLIEDDPASAEPLIAVLNRRGLVVDHVSNWEDVLDRVDAADLVLLDLERPDIDGVQLCRRIRSTSDVPIIACSSQGEIAERILALHAGADDYVFKPYDLGELLARITALLRRSGKRVVAPPDRTTIGALTIDWSRGDAAIAEEPVALSQDEFTVLAVLAEANGKVCVTERIIEAVWGADAPESGTLDRHIAQLQEKLGSSVSIDTIRGVGYRLTAR